MRHTKLSFPERKIKIIHADIELEVDITDEEYGQLTDVFNRQDMNPMIKLTLISPEGKAEFTNLKLMQDDEL